MQNFRYKIATSEDLSDILQLKNKVKEHNNKIHLDIWQKDYPSKNLIMEDIQNQRARILVDSSKKVIAFSCLQPTEFEYSEADFPKSYMTFSRLMVDCDLQGQGIGTFFIEELIKESKAKQKQGMIITVDFFNDSAIHVYKKFGFEKLGVLSIPQAKYILDVYSLKFV